MDQKANYYLPGSNANIVSVDRQQGDEHDRREYAAKEVFYLLDIKHNLKDMITFFEEFGGDSPMALGHIDRAKAVIKKAEGK